MNVKEAVRAANKYITELFADEEVQDLGLEEVVFDETANAWKNNHRLLSALGATQPCGQPWGTRMEETVRSKSLRSMTILVKS